MRTWIPIAGCLLFAATASGADDIAGAERRWAAADATDVPQFTRHVQPLLGKAGCSNRACHGSFQGKGGFRLSLFASDPKLDYDNLANSGRIDRDDPDESLILQKPRKPSLNCWKCSKTGN